jgi:energy-coupling factor transporter ATP-binding protein EcfA2
VLVSRLSGGQRKRVSIGVELLADPRLFFLDEPTSGLDPGLDFKMMQLLRKLASQGRTIVLVTHATANIKLCDRIVFMGRGGKLCYFGVPDQASEFFSIASGDFVEIYNELEQGETVVNRWAETYRKSPYYQTYISSHLGGNTPMASSRFAPRPIRSPFLRQMLLLSQRYRQLLLRDPANLRLALITAPIGISLMTMAVQDRATLILPGSGEPDPALAPLASKILLVFTCAAIWVGLSSSLQEIVKEKAIYLRERLVNLGILAYLGSKIFVLSGLALLQTLLISITLFLCFQSPDSDLITWPVGAAITTFLTLVTSISLGLMVSAVVRNSSQANSALPLLLLPQIIFSGVLFNTEGEFGEPFSWLMLSRWSVAAYGTLVNVNAFVPDAITLSTGEVLPQPFEPLLMYSPTWRNLLLNWGVLLIHCLAYWLITARLQKQKDIF